MPEPRQNSQPPPPHHPTIKTPVKARNVLENNKTPAKLRSAKGSIPSPLLDRRRTMKRTPVKAKAKLKAKAKAGFDKKGQKGTPGGDTGTVRDLIKKFDRIRDGLDPEPRPSKVRNLITSWSLSSETNSDSADTPKRGGM